MLHNTDPIEFEFPVSADADRVMDKNGLEVCQISSLCSPKEAMRWAKFFAGSFQAYALLDGIKHLLIAGLDEDHEPSTHEDGAMCIICDIDAFLASIMNEPKAPSSIITE